MSTIIGFAGQSDDLQPRIDRGLRALSDLPVLDLARSSEGQGTVVALRHWPTDPTGFAHIQDWYCAADARIDNVDELGEKLSAVGVRLSSEANAAELILSCFLGYAEQTWDWLRGDFACALWCPRQRRLVLARDVVGARPLYYSQGRAGVTFASELRALLAMCGDAPSLDLSQAHRRLYAGGSGAPQPGRTLIDGVCSVEPGCWRQWRGAEQSAARYWDPQRIAQSKALSADQAAAALQQRVQTAIGRRTAVAGRVGCHLSGGMDCSTLAAMLWRQRDSSAALPTFYSWTPSSVVAENASELRQLNRLVDAEQIPVTFLDPQAIEAGRAQSQTASVDPRLPWESMALEQHVQVQAQADGVSHLISGWGGDEVASHQGLGLAPELLLRGRWIALLRLLTVNRGGRGRPGLGSLLRRARRELLGPFAARLRSSSSIEGLASAMLRQRHPFKRNARWSLAIALSVRQGQLWRLSDGYLSQRMESWYCHGKRHGISYSYPLLDRDVLELCLSLPGEYYLRDGHSRYLFRRACAEYWRGDAIWSLSKHESGLAGYLQQSTSASRDRDSVLAQLRCLDPGSDRQGLLDRERLQRVCGRLDGTDAGLAWVLLANAEWLIGYAQALADMDLETPVGPA